MIRFVKDNKFFLLGLLVLFTVVLVNLFPKGYVFAGGDTIQFIEAKNNLKSLFYNWQGKAITFYSIFYILDYLHVSYSGQLSFYLGIFIFGSYISFQIFAKLLFKKSSDLSRSVVSLFYALNLYTLFLFSGNWGYSYFPSLYIFIPLLTGLFIKFLKSQKFVFGIFFVLAVFLSSSGFGNPAFLLSFVIFLILTLLFLVAFRLIIINKKTIIGVIIIAIACILINAYWLLPLIPQVKGQVADIYSSDVLEYNWEIRNAASPIFNTLSLIHYSLSHFPYNFPYKNITFLKKLFIIIAFLPAVFIFIGALFLKKFKDTKKKYFLAFLGLMAVMIMLIARVVPPFEIINNYVYGIWGFNTMRGFDKTAIYFPFIFGVLILIILTELNYKKWLLTMAIIILVIPLPFYLGKFQQTVGYRNNNGKNFQAASMSFLVKIPDEYYKIRNIINNDKEESFIATLPYSSNDGSGISSYPKWKLYAVDITKYLYNKDYIGANDSYFKDRNFALDFNNDYSGQYDWIVKLLGIMNSKYIIYHKDSPSDSVARTESKIRNLEEKGMINKIEDNDYFTLYSINKDYFYPRVVFQKTDVDISRESNSISRNVGEAMYNLEPANFSEINPKKFIVAANQNKTFNNIVLSEPYDANWKAYIMGDNKQKTEIKNHFKALGYANGWQMGDDPNIKEIMIEYYPIELMRKGIAISLATALFLIIYLINYYYANKKRDKNFVLLQKYS